MDDNLSVKANLLTDDQLVGILSEKVKYPEKIRSAVQTELDWRQIDEGTLDYLKAQYHKPIVLKGEIHFNYGPVLLAVLVLIFRYSFLSLPGMVLGLSILFISLVAVRRKYEKGPQSAQKIWRIFGVVLLLLTVVAIMIAFTF